MSENAREYEANYRKPPVRTDGLHAVTRHPPQTGKVMRMQAQTAMIPNGFVHLPKEAPWLAEHLREQRSPR
jgi:phage terminase large subunit-like protein